MTAQRHRVPVVPVVPVDFPSCCSLSSQREEKRSKREEQWESTGTTGTNRPPSCITPRGTADRCPTSHTESNRHTDANVHAHHEEAVAPNCSLGPVWCRDAADGRPIVALLHRLARRRGVAHVRAAVARWLREVR